MRPSIVYTDDFRRSVVQEVVAGKWTGYSHAQRAYGIKGSVTVRKWMVRYGYGHLLERIVVMKGEQEVSEVNRLKAEVRKLKESVADLYLDLQIEKQISGILLEETEKKREASQSGLRSRPTHSPATQKNEIALGLKKRDPTFDRPDVPAERASIRVGIHHRRGEGRLKKRPFGIIRAARPEHA